MIGISRSLTFRRQSLAKAAAARQRGYLRTHLRIENGAVRGLRPMYDQILRSVLMRLRDAGDRPDPDAIFHPSEWRDQFNLRLLPWWRSGLGTGVDLEAAWIKAQSPQQQRLEHLVRQELTDPIEELPTINVPLSGQSERQIKTWLRARQVGIWDQVGKTLHARIRRDITEGIKSGETLDELSKRLAATLNTQKEWQARRIARTETTGAMQFGGHVERIDAEIPMKQWWSVMDEWTRVETFDHLTPHQQVRPNLESFLISGEPLMHPGDNSLGASGGNVINCRCAAVSYWDD